ncbi:MAG: DUF192 domain-containing protein [Candidatus Micrarchaeota archaeon]|nr:DUF192 domain-containing protein [Candidatus Micrarchaeota archaeon]
MLTKILYHSLRFRSKKVRFARRLIKLDLADNFAEQIVGLMYRKKMGENEGMLFRFGSSGFQRIWMLNMNFAIDVVWADEAGKVVDIAKNLQPCNGMFGCEAYGPKARAKYVLELKSGMSARLGIKVGSSIGGLIW